MQQAKLDVKEALNHFELVLVLCVSRCTWLCKGKLGNATQLIKKKIELKARRAMANACRVCRIGA